MIYTFVAERFRIRMISAHFGVYISSMSKPLNAMPAYTSLGQHLEPERDLIHSSAHALNRIIFDPSRRTRLNMCTSVFCIRNQFPPRVHGHTKMMMMMYSQFPKCFFVVGWRASCVVVIGKSNEISKLNYSCEMSACACVLGVRTSVRMDPFWIWCLGVFGVSQRLRHIGVT